MRIRHAAVLLALLGFVTAAWVGVASAKGHVPADQVQVSHKGRVALSVDAPALKGHSGHGDIQLPACDFNNIFLDGQDTSNVIASDETGVTYSDRGFVPRADAGGVTPACPPGAF